MNPQKPATYPSAPGPRSPGFLAWEWSHHISGLLSKQVSLGFACLPWQRRYEQEIISVHYPSTHMLPPAAEILRETNVILSTQQVQKVQVSLSKWVSTLGGKGYKYSWGTPGTQQAYPRYEATFLSQPHIPGLRMIDPQQGDWAKGPSCRNPALWICTLQGCFSYSRKNPLSHHRMCSTHPLQAAILVKIKCLQSGGEITQSLPHPQPRSRFS